MEAYGWREVFIIEGALAFLLIAIWLPFISDRSSEAKWISKEERDWIETRLREEQKELLASGESNSENVSIDKILRDLNVWKLSVIYSCFCIGILGFALWLPTIIKSLTDSGMTGVGMLSAIPYIATIIGFWTKLADETMNRRFYTALGFLIFSICLGLSVVFQANLWLSFTFLTGCGLMFKAPSSTFWTLLLSLFKSDMRQVLVGL